MHPHEDLIRRFYAAFQRRDASAMADCYHPDVEFSDPAFPGLRGARAVGMWRMLCERGADLRIEFGDVAADDRAGRARWEAWYTFSLTGRPVHNVIRAEFEFRDGRIVRHTDRFDLHKWMSMALGWRGRVFGWLPPVQRGAQRKFARVLDAYLAAPGPAGAGGAS